MGSAFVHCVRTDSTGRNSQSKSELTNLCDTLISIERGDLMGVWGEDTLKNATFVIAGDSIRYVEHYDAPYYFEIRNDSILIHLDGFDSFWRICCLRNDSLVVLDEYGETFYYKKLYQR